MSFLSIAFLAALPLAAAPILLHLFDRRRNVVIDWGAMQFLLEAAQRRSSARKLKQWLLLLLRVCAVAALVLALARPRLPGNWFGGIDRGETLLILDNSMSMSRLAGDATLFETAIDRAVETLDDLPAGDSVRVLLASPYPVWAIAGSLRLDDASRPLVEEQLRELQPTLGRSDLLAALFTAVQTELEPTQHRRRIILLTDGQSSDWQREDQAGWERFREVLKSAPIATELQIVELEQPGGGAANVAINRVHGSRTVVGVDQTFALAAQIQNRGLVPSAPGPVSWFVEQDEVHARHLPALDAGQSQDVIWKHSFSRTGVYAISCRVETDDALPADNRATVVVEVVDKVPVVVVEGAAQLAEMQQDAFFVLAALGWMDGAPLDVRGVHEPTLIDPERLAHLDLAGQRVVVVPNLTTLSEESCRHLRQFVEEGGGLWLALGPRTDIDAFNQQLYVDGHGLAPLAVEGIVDEQPRPSENSSGESRLRIDPFVAPHPATAELADSQQLDLADVTIARRFRFVAPPEQDDVSVLLSLSNGEPLAVEKYVGRGRVIVQGVPLRLQWSRLARSQAFVVMVQDWLDYLSQPGATRHNLNPGEPIALQRTDREIRNATLHTPHGDAIELTADLEPDGVSFRTNRTILPGDYALEIGLAGDRLPFHVNRDPEESDLTPLSGEERQALADLAGLRQTALSDGLAGSNQYEPIWPLLLLLLIGLIAAELLLSGAISRERYGGPAISETSEPFTSETKDIPFAFAAKSATSTAPGRPASADVSHTVEL